MCVCDAYGGVQFLTDLEVGAADKKLHVGLPQDVVEDVLDGQYHHARVVLVAGDGVGLP